MEATQVSSRSDQVIELFASTTDAFLQELKEALNASPENTRGVAIISARLAQLGRVYENYFKGASAYACADEDDLKAANVAVKQTGEMLMRRLEELGAIVQVNSVHKQPSPAGDRSLN